MNLMARARVLSPELNSPSLWFFCRRWVEFPTTTLSSTTPYWVWVLIRPLFFRFQKFLTLDPLSRVSVVVKLDLLRLLLNPQTFYVLNEGFNRWDGWLLRLFLGFLLPVDCLELRTLFDLRLEGELLLLTIDVELDFSSSHIDTRVCCAQERSPQDERCLGVDLHVEDDEVDGNQEIPDFDRNVLRYSCRVTNRLVR